MLTNKVNEKQQIMGLASFSVSIASLKSKGSEHIVSGCIDLIKPCASKAFCILLTPFSFE